MITAINVIDLRAKVTVKAEVEVQERMSIDSSLNHS